VRKIVEEALEAEVADALGRDYYENGAAPGRHLLGILSKYVDYYNAMRTHLSLAKDAPEPRSVYAPRQPRVVEVPRVGGLHHILPAGGVSRSDE
jgi:hypothetical protein